VVGGDTRVRDAIAFLTRVPVAAGDGPGAAWFGLVGAVLGAVAAIPVLLLSGHLGLAWAVLAVAILAIGSGALHLDGLADTADALAAPDPGRAEVARRDPRTGAAGVTAVVLVLLLDVLTLALLAPQEWAALVLVAAVAMSRGVLPLVAVLVGRRAAGRGAEPRLGTWFVSRVSLRAAAISAASAAVPGVVALAAFGWRGPLVAAAAGIVGGVVVAAVIARLRHGLDGDGFGAVAEIVTPIALLASTAAWQ
jgi:adenosylcobinamide-GDP ribazoletransferase